MKAINKLCNRKIMEVESCVSESESRFVEEIAQLIKLKGQIDIEKRKLAAKEDWLLTTNNF